MTPKDVGCIPYDLRRKEKPDDSEGEGSSSQERFTVTMTSSSTCGSVTGDAEDTVQPYNRELSNISAGAYRCKANLSRASLWSLSLTSSGPVRLQTPVIRLWYDYLGQQHRSSSRPATAWTALKVLPTTERQSAHGRRVPLQCRSTTSQRKPFAVTIQAELRQRSGSTAVDIHTPVGQDFDQFGHLHLAVGFRQRFDRQAQRSLNCSVGSDFQLFNVTVLVPPAKSPPADPQYEQAGREDSGFNLPPGEPMAQGYRYIQWLGRINFYLNTSRSTPPIVGGEQPVSDAVLQELCYNNLAGLLPFTLYKAFIRRLLDFETKQNELLQGYQITWIDKDNVPYTANQTVDAQRFHFPNVCAEKRSTSIGSTGMGIPIYVNLLNNVVVIPEPSVVDTVPRVDVTTVHRGNHQANGGFGAASATFPCTCLSLNQTEVRIIENPKEVPIQNQVKSILDADLEGAPAAADAGPRRKPATRNPRSDGIKSIFPNHRRVKVEPRSSTDREEEQHQQRGRAALPEERRRAAPSLLQYRSGRRRQMSPHRNIRGASGHSGLWPLLPKCQISCPVSKSLKFDTHIPPPLTVRQMSPHRNIRGVSGHSGLWPLLPKCQISCPVSKTIRFDTHIAPTLTVQQMSPHRNIRGASGHSGLWPLLPKCQISCPVSKSLKFDTHIPPPLTVRQMSPHRNIRGVSGHSGLWPLLPKCQISCPVSKTIRFDTHIAPTLTVQQMSPHRNIRGASGHSGLWPLLPKCKISCLQAICSRTSRPSATGPPGHLLLMCPRRRPAIE
ncbi:conserved hypothetical protein [Culex quinquefasciatus]|uniref:Uncharacterized protein n=1 Tax=Culex quinquefasciatus TaxID=7176 RepID=B0X3E2_CULQU|nr:conserved hypothetical protein [Culex quinquefasciatus]|eukprot:XP_001864164.1 conserved hypothetical protein [Culex quinquefasciatus]